jgi:tungstate transport system substrate-binding protein
MPRTTKRRAARWSVVVVALGAIALLALTFSNFASGGGTSKPASQRLAAAPDYTQLLIETTTSVRDSGLMDAVVVPAFEARFPDVTFKYVAVGSGQALADAAAGNCDAIIVHSPEAEHKVQRTGNITMRLPFAYNYFTIVGPKSDPAHVRGASSAKAAFKAIFKYGKAHPKQTVWVSRGDNSGTYAKELQIWQSAGITINAVTPPSWYISTGQGMGQTLTMTDQKKDAYTLTDIATWLKNRPSLSSLKQVLSTRRDMLNQYSIDLLNQAAHPAINSASAEALAAWLTSKAGQQAIANYKIRGTQVFFPNSYAVSIQWLPPLTP